MRDPFSGIDRAHKDPKLVISNSPAPNPTSLQASPVIQSWAHLIRRPQCLRPFGLRRERPIFASPLTLDPKCLAYLGAPLESISSTQTTIQDLNLGLGLGHAVGDSLTEPLLTCQFSDANQVCKEVFHTFRSRGR